MLYAKQLKDGRIRHKSKPLLISPAQAYIPPVMDFKTSTSVWLTSELIKKRVKDWRQLTDEDGHSGLRSILRKDTVFTGTHSVFPIPLVEWILARYAPKPHSKVLDAFAGGPPRAIAASLMCHHYYGIEIRQEQIDENLEVIKGIGNFFTVNYICGDGRFLDFEETDFDIALTCPPFWNVEVYSDHKDDISNFKTYESFNAAMQMSAWSHFDKMKSGSFVCIIVGNFRDKKGELIDFCGHTIENFKDAGFIFHDEIILLNNFGSAAKRAGTAWKGKKLVRIHQYLLIFRRP